MFYNINGIIIEYIEKQYSESFITHKIQCGQAIVATECSLTMVQQAHSYLASFLWLEFWCLTPLSTVIQLHSGNYNSVLNNNQITHPLCYKNHSIGGV